MPKLLSEYKEIILKYANEYDEDQKKAHINSNHPGRPREYSNITILYYVQLMLEHVTKWRSLRIIAKKKKKGFYTTILKYFIEWSAYGVFEKAYREILRKYIFDEMNEETCLELYIDGALVYNKGGIDEKGKGENRKKNNTKITLVCDENCIIYDVQFYIVQIFMMCIQSNHQQTK